MDVELSQTYYTNALASQYDPRYTTSFTAAQANNFSPLVLGVRVMPTTNINATVRTEFDSRYKEARTLTVNGSFTILGTRVATSNDKEWRKAQKAQQKAIKQQQKADRKAAKEFNKNHR